MVEAADVYQYLVDKVLTFESIGPDGYGALRARGRWFDGWGLKAREVRGLPTVLGPINSGTFGRFSTEEGLDKFLEDSRNAATRKGAIWRLSVRRDTADYLNRLNDRLTDGSKVDRRIPGGGSSLV